MVGSGRGNMNWKDCEVVESRPDKLSGAWVFRGTRVPVEALFETLLGRHPVGIHRVVPRG
jgi:uncharacterized protein (DUF433 family)